MTYTFQTRFGLFVPCDLATYKLLKRLRHCSGFADVMARRWSRAQKRLPRNRYFRRGRLFRRVTQDMLFEPFWQAGALADPTALLGVFLRDYESAKHPVKTEAEVRPLVLTREQLVALLTKLEDWHRQVFAAW